MRFYTLFAVLFLSLSFGSCPPGETTAPSVVMVDRIVGPESDVQAISRAGRELVAAFEDENLEAVLAHLTLDAVVSPPGRPDIRGHEALRVFYRQQFQRLKVDEIGMSLSELVVMGDWAFTRGDALIAISASGGGKLSAHQRGLEIWRKQPDGSWKVARAISNEVRPFSQSADESCCSP